MASPSEAAVLTVRLFAAARERAKQAQIDVTVPSGCTAQQVLDAVVARVPSMASLVPHLRVAVNQEFVALNFVVPAGAEVALIPPVAGGTAGLFRVVDRPLVLDEVIAAVHSTSRGGLVTFSGAVRDFSKGQVITRLEYEAYVPMAEKKLEAIGLEARAQWPQVEVAVVHRVGVLVPGELAVVIAVAAPHRHEAFRACEFVIERLKQDVPIWKKEFAASGEVWVGLGP